jgi:hypothetical protein
MVPLDLDPAIVAPESEEAWRETETKFKDRDAEPLGGKEMTELVDKNEHG